VLNEGNSKKMSEATIGGIPVPQCYRDIEDALKSGIDRLILFGPPGTGKTFAGLNTGINDAGAERLICTEDMTNADVSGAFMPSSDGGFSFLPGAALRAWQGNGTVGSRLVIDEIDKAGGDVFATLLAFTDTIESASFTRPDTGAVVRPLAGFSVVMTSNIEHPDELPMALRDRFPVAIKVDAAHPNALLRLPVELQQLAATIVAGRPGQRASLRAFYDFDKLRKNPEVGAERAANLVFGHMAQPIIDALSVGTLTPSYTLA
jgi:MoxR-like ATPase